MYIQRHLSFMLRHPVSTQYAYNNFFLTHNLHIHVISMLRSAKKFLFKFFFSPSIRSV